MLPRIAPTLSLSSIVGKPASRSTSRKRARTRGVARIGGGSPMGRLTLMSLRWIAAVSEVSWPRITEIAGTKLFATA